MTSKSSLPRDGNNSPIQVGHPLADGTKTVAYTASVGTSTAYVGTKVVRLYATTLCHVEIGPNAATDCDTNSMPFPAGVYEYFFVRNGDYISAIRSSADGSLYITEMD